MITIVAGLPRSGTSLMMQMLDAGGLPVLTDGERAADEDNPRGYFEFEAVKRVGDHGWLDEAEGHVVKLVHALLPTLPSDRQYRVVFMLRNLDEVIVSQRVMLERLGRPGAAISPDALHVQYAREYTFFERWCDEQAHVKALFVRYNELVQDPEPVIRELVAFAGVELDVELDAERMREVVDPALYRVRKAQTP